MAGHTVNEAVAGGESYTYEPWYKYGIGVLFLEAGIAVAVSIFSISMGLSGKPVAFKKHVVFEKKKPAIVAPAPQQAQQGATDQRKALQQQLGGCPKAAGRKP